MLEEGEEGPVKEQLLALQMARAVGTEADPAQWRPVLEKILNYASVQEAPLRSVRFLGLPWLRTAAAAAIIFSLSTLAFFITRHHAGTPEGSDGVLVKAAGSGILPGGNHAILTLSGGRTILLDSAQNGLLNNSSTVQILKLENGRLAYTIPGKGQHAHNAYNGSNGSHNSDAAPGEMLYNSLTTPRGGFYQVRLPDGTEVWLNAASSLRFPETFSGTNREVAVTGEAYFEVATDKTRPFIVNARHTRVTVLGTSFNINAYEDEKTLTTTLLTGSVKYEADGQTKLLRPGQQAIFDSSARALSQREADIMSVTAWKNGRFEFENIELPEILRQISRWYNVDIRYNGHIGNARFGGGLSRQLSLEKVLHYLESTGMHFTLDREQHVIIVSP